MRAHFSGRDEISEEIGCSFVSLKFTFTELCKEKVA